MLPKNLIHLWRVGHEDFDLVWGYMEELNEQVSVEDLGFKDAISLPDNIVTATVHLRTQLRPDIGDQIGYAGYRFRVVGVRIPIGDRYATYDYTVDLQANVEEYAG